MNIILSIFILLFPIVGFAQSDSTNRIGEDGKKFGYWTIYGKDRPYSGHVDNAIYEEGKYVNGSKEGKWIQYYPNQNRKSEVEYKAGRPNGRFKTYYENGELEGKGTWLLNRYTDTFYRYYPGNKLAQLRFFNLNGKSQGWQTFYNEKGEIELKFYTHNGSEVADSGFVDLKSGTMREVPAFKINPILSNEELCLCEINKLSYPYIHTDENGDSVVNYSTSHYLVKLVGKFKSSKLYEGNCYLEISNDEIKLHTYHVEEGKFKKILTDGVDVPERSKWQKIYNQDKQIEYDGLFVENKFQEGKRYYYDVNGLLKKIEVYKEGKFVGEAQKE